MILIKYISNLNRKFMVGALFIIFSSFTIGQEYPFTHLDDRSIANISMANSFEPPNVIHSVQKAEVNATGNFSLTVPLLKVPGRGGLDFDINLSYTPGIKVTDEASWVGLGWDLDIGSINRKIILEIDNTINQKVYHPDGDEDTLFDDHSRDNYFVNFQEGQATILQFDSDNSNYFKFTTKELNAWKIEYGELENRFIITVGDGTTYVFGMAAPGASLYSGVRPDPDYWCGLDIANFIPFKKWHLTAILASNYSDGGGDVYDPLDDNIENNRGNWIKIEYSFDGESDFRKYLYQENPPFVDRRRDISLTSVTYPSYIVTPNYIAKFETEEEAANPISYLMDVGYDGYYDHVFQGGKAANSRRRDDFLKASPEDEPARKLKRRLKSIKLFKYEISDSEIPEDLGDAIKEFEFEYIDPNTSMIENNPNGYKEKRTMLRGINITAGNITLNPYHFTYYDVIGNQDPFSDRFAEYYAGALWEPHYNHIGFLGYYNSSIGTFNNENYFIGKQNDGKMWNLEKITYPTGGNITFDYESNKYFLDFLYSGNIEDFEERIIWGAGCRVTKQIVNNNSITTNYEYEYSTNINGIPEIGLGRMHADEYSYYAIFGTPDDDNSLMNTKGTKTYYGPIFGAQYLQRKLRTFYLSKHQVLYQNVREIIKRGTVQNASILSIYNVPDIDESIAPSEGTEQEMFEKVIKYRGILKSKEYKNDEDVIVKVENYIKNEEMLNYEYQLRPLFSYWCENSSTTTSIFNQNGIEPVTTSVEQIFNDKNTELKELIETNSDGSIRTTRYRYPVDFNSGVDDFITANILTPVLLTYVEDDDAEIYSTKIVKYQAFPAFNLKPRKVIELASYSLPYNNSVDLENYLATDDYNELCNITLNSAFRADFDITKYYDYDYWGNVIETYSGNATHLVELDWGYNHSKPVSEIVNCYSYNVFLDGYENGNNWISNLEIDDGQYFTGKNSGKIVNPGSERLSSINNVILNTLGGTKFRISSWVYSDGPTVEMCLINPNGNTIIQSVSTDTVGVWKYVEKEIELPSGITGIKLRLDNNGGGTVWFDEVRVVPSHAQVVTLRYDNKFLLPSSISQANGKVIFYNYDDLGRTSRIFDSYDNLLAEYSYSGDLRTTITNSYQSTGKYGIALKTVDDNGNTIATGVKYREGSTEEDIYITSGNEYNWAGRKTMSHDPKYSDVIDDRGSGCGDATLYYEPFGRLRETGRNSSSDWTIGGSHSQIFTYGSNSIADNIAGFNEGELYKTISKDEDGHINHEFMDGFGNLVATVIDAANLKLKTTFEYDEIGNLLKSTPPKGSNYSTDFDYNSRGLLISKQSPDDGAAEYCYDINGNLRFVKDQNHSDAGTFIYNKYDSQSRIIEVGEYSLITAFDNEYENINFPEDNDQYKNLLYKYFYDETYIDGQNNLSGELSKCVVYNDEIGNLTTYYSYNYRGKIEWLLYSIPDHSDKKVSYWYDLQSNIVKKCVTDLADNSLYTFYEYDLANRLTKVLTNGQDDISTAVTEAEYEYNAAGLVTQKIIGQNEKQTINYEYNEKEWLIAINDVNQIESDLFAEELHYDMSDLMGVEPRFNGNIAAVKYKNMAITSNPEFGYGFTYDGANRLVAANSFIGSGWNTTYQYALSNVSYDANGNITNLERNNSYGTIADDMDYGYISNSNRISNIIDNSNNTILNNYSYDGNGNIISDSYRDLTNISYNHLNLPTQLTLAGSETIKYHYDSKGNRFIKRSDDNAEFYVLGANGETEAIFDMEGNVKFYNIASGSDIIGRYEPFLESVTLTENELHGTYSGVSITTEGNVSVTGNSTFYANTKILLAPGFKVNSGVKFKTYTGRSSGIRSYYLKDHLGSIRITFDDQGEILSSNDYDPWGMQLDGRSSNAGSAFEKYKFTGKERDRKTGLDYFGARYYDSKFARWMSVDPKAEKYPGLSPYNYCAGNPSRFIDPDGRGIKEALERWNNALSLKITIGLNVGFNAKAFGANAGMSANFQSTPILTVDKSTATWFSGERSTGVNLRLGFVEVGCEKTLSPTTETVVHTDIEGLPVPSTDIVQTNSLTETIFVGVIGVGYKHSTKTTREYHPITKKKTDKVETISEASAGKIGAGVSVLLGIEFSIDLIETLGGFSDLIGY